MNKRLAEKAVTSYYAKEQRSTRISSVAGKFLLLGACLQNISVNPAALLVRETAFKASYGCDMKEFRHCIELVRSGRIDVNPIISGTVSLDELPAAFERLCEPNDEVKLILEIS